MILLIIMFIIECIILAIMTYLFNKLAAKYKDAKFTIDYLNGKIKVLNGRIIDLNKKLRK